MADYRTFAVDIARESGMLLKSKLNDHRKIDFKGEIDIVTDADRMSEDMILSAIEETLEKEGADDIRVNSLFKAALHWTMMSCRKNQSPRKPARRSAGSSTPWTERRITPTGTPYSVCPLPSKGREKSFSAWCITPCWMKCSSQKRGRALI